MELRGTGGGGDTDGSRTTESGQDPVSRTIKGTDLAQGGLAKSKQLMTTGQVARFHSKGAAKMA